MSMKTIRLELGRTAQWPDGNPDCGYEFKAPLDETGHISVEEWRANRDASTVRRFWQGEDDQNGHLIHTRHRTWAFSYRPGEEDDTPFFRFESHVFVAGDYVSIDEHDGETYTFKVASVS
jgi:hypothetical protein